MTLSVEEQARVNAPTQQRFALSYGDCDALGISYFAINYPWMERTYSVWLHGLGLDSDTMLDRIGAYTVGLKSECQYFTSCRVFDELVCTVVLEKLGNTSYVLGFDFTRGDELVAHGAITYAVRGADGAKAPIPPALLEALQTLGAPRAA
ncbi:acyl-CoA thioesterase [Gordonia rhizosphera]|uniref:Putative thioesterase n=1 Tax=Gordonia rhizosphera NBRC 16068 TaxID=1108045 RepID=K6V758_9ACTN|nr:hotdog domain-containing protein [Gordonia rhizosphera]GAB92073.1 putative thioesterase [Gordonia rhizosphera NBRC 16068]